VGAGKCPDRPTTSGMLSLKARPNDPRKTEGMPRRYQGVYSGLSLRGKNNANFSDTF